MPALDYIHEAVRNALIKDGWIITHDPFTIAHDELVLFADLGAERPLAARRGRQERLIEIKSFTGPSLMRDFETALGQFLVFRALLKAKSSRRKTVLAVDEEVFESFLTMTSIQLILREYRVRLLVVRLDAEEIVRWID
jgi:hypothetical protein